MNALLYISVIIIWGTTWFAIYLQQGDVPVTVSIFYRFLLAAVIMLVALLAARRLRRLALKDHLFASCRAAASFASIFTASITRRLTSPAGWNR